MIHLQAINKLYIHLDSLLILKIKIYNLKIKILIL